LETISIIKKKSLAAPSGLLIAHSNTKGLAFRTEELSRPNIK